MTIEQTIDFPGLSADRLVRVYMDAKAHAAAIGAPVEIDPRPGGRFSAYGGLTGRMLLLEGRRVVQTWRADVWREHDPDSILVLSFEDVAGGGRIRLAQVDVPEHAHRTIADGWRQHYWDKWTRHVTTRS